MHEKSVHFTSKPFKCKDCNACFESQPELIIHVDETIHSLQERSFNCDSCTKSFKKEKALRKHFDKVHLNYTIDNG